MADEIIFVAASADAPLVVPGSSFDRKCGRCGKAVMISPSGQKFLKNTYGVTVICMQCAKPEDVRGELKLSTGTVQSLVEECRTAVPNMRRHRN